MINYEPTTLFPLQSQQHQCFNINGFYPEIWYLILGELIKKHGDLGWRNRLHLGYQQEIYLDLSNVTRYKKMEPLYKVLVAKQRQSILTAHLPVVISNESRIGSVYADDSLLDALAQTLTPLDQKKPPVSAAYLRIEIARLFYLQQYESYQLKNTLLINEKANLDALISNQVTFISQSFNQLPFFYSRQNEASATIQNYIQYLDQFIKNNGDEFNFNDKKNELLAAFSVEFIKTFGDVIPGQLPFIFSSYEFLFKEYLNLLTRKEALEKQSHQLANFRNQFEIYDHSSYSLSDLNKPSQTLTHLDPQVILPLLADHFKVKITINNSIHYGSNEAENTVNLLFDQNEKIYYPIIPIKQLDHEEICKKNTQKNPVSINLPDVILDVFKLIKPHYSKAYPEFINLQGNRFPSNTRELVYSIIHKSFKFSKLKAELILKLDRPQPLNRLESYFYYFASTPVLPVNAIYDFIDNKTIILQPSGHLSVALSTKSSTSLINFLLQNISSTSLVIDLNEFNVVESLSNYLDSYKEILSITQSGHYKLEELIIFGSQSYATLTPELWKVIDNALNSGSYPSSIKLVLGGLSINDDFFTYFKLKKINELVLFNCQLTAETFISERHQNTNIVSMRVIHPVTMNNLSMDNSLISFVKQFPKLDLLHLSEVHFDNLSCLLNLNTMRISKLLLDNNQVDLNSIPLDPEQNVSYLNRGIHLVYLVGQQEIKNSKNTMLNHLRINLFDSAWRIISSSNLEYIKKLITTLKENHDALTLYANEFNHLSNDNWFIINSLTDTLSSLINYTKNAYMTLHMIQHIDNNSFNALKKSVDNGSIQNQNNLNLTDVIALGMPSDRDLAEHCFHHVLKDSVIREKGNHVSNDYLRDQATQRLVEATTPLIFNLRKDLFDTLDAFWFNPALTTLSSLKLPPHPIFPIIHNNMYNQINNNVMELEQNDTLELQLEYSPDQPENHANPESPAPLPSQETRLIENIGKVKLSLSTLQSTSLDLITVNQIIFNTIHSLINSTTNNFNNPIIEFPTIEHLVIDKNNNLESTIIQINQILQTTTTNNKEMQPTVLSQIVINYLEAIYKSADPFIARTTIPHVTITNLSIRKQHMMANGNYLPLSDIKPNINYKSHSHLTLFGTKQSREPGDLLIETIDHSRKRTREKGVYLEN